MSTSRQTVPLRTPRVVVVGAGAGGLTAGILLATRGLDVTIVESAAAPGGKIRTQTVCGQAIDAGPTVLTMRWVFEEIFNEAGARFEDHIGLRPAEILARHVWAQGETLDLFADRAKSARAIAAFSGRSEAQRYLDFCAETARTYKALERTFMTAERPSMAGLVRRAGVGALLRAGPFSDMWTALGKAFADERLRQLFGRYATYVGSSPFLAPAMMMLIAHVEQEGVWLVNGGMARLAEAMASLAAGKGASLRYDERVAEIRVSGNRASGVTLASGETLDADAIVLNADVSALATGRFGSGAAKAAGVAATSVRSLSAVTFACLARTEGFPLTRHNVFFSPDYRAEFDDLFARRHLPDDATVYVCAQDRETGAAVPEAERLFILVNAPADGDRRPLTPQEILECERRTLSRLERAGLRIHRLGQEVTTPTDFETRFPATGGALYGAATHGAMASFARPSSRTRLPCLYLAGGSAHPGAGVPMAALSGRIAATAILQDLASTHRFHATVTPGGTSMR